MSTNASDGQGDPPVFISLTKQKKEPVPEPKMMLRCPCGQRCWAHWEQCFGCGRPMRRGA